MKYTFKLFGFLLAFSFILSLSSCAGDSCYTCTDSDLLVDTSFCDIIDGTKDEIDELIDLYETAGGNCQKQ